MRQFINNVSDFIRERLELRGKMDEPTLKKYRCFGIHVRSAAEIIAIIGFLAYAMLTSSEYFRHRYASTMVSMVSAMCYLTLIYGINSNTPWAHWLYFFINPIALILQFIFLIVAHTNAAPHEYDLEANDDHLWNMISLIVFIGFIQLLNGYCIYIVYRSYKYMLDYLRKEAHIAYHGAEMTDVLRVPQDAEFAEELDAYEREEKNSPIA